jgi:hypothetical protein
MDQRAVLEQLQFPGLLANSIWHERRYLRITRKLLKLSELDDLRGRLVHESSKSLLRLVEVPSDDECKWIIQRLVVHRRDGEVEVACMVVRRSFSREFADGDLGNVDSARRVLCVGMIELFGVRLWLCSLEDHVEAGYAFPDSELELLRGSSVSRTNLSGTDPISQSLTKYSVSFAPHGLLGNGMLNLIVWNPTSGRVRLLFDAIQLRHTVTRQGHLDCLKVVYGEYIAGRSG